MRVGCYVRVSGRDQIEGYSLDAQRAILTAYCAGRGWADLTWYADEGRVPTARGARSGRRSARSSVTPSPSLPPQG